MSLSGEKPAGIVTHLAVPNPKLSRETSLSSDGDGDGGQVGATRVQFVVPQTLPLRPIEIIGIGAFSTVCRAEAQFGSGKNSFAIKKLENALSKDTNPTVEDIARVAREIVILKALSHPFLLSAKGVWMSGIDVYIATQHVEFELGALVERHRRQNTFFPIEQIEMFTFQLLSGLAYLHGVGIVHCDLCPRNILIDRHGHLCIADFGISRPSFTGVLWNRVKFDRPGITMYTAPEIVLNVVHKLKPESDLWSTGCILYELFNNKPFVNTIEPIQAMLNCMSQVLGRPNTDLTKRLYPTAADIMNSIFCDGIPKIRAVVPEYFDKNNLEGSESVERIEAFTSIMKKMITFEYDKRLGAKGILKTFAQSPIFSSLITEWDVGKITYETFVNKDDHLTNVKNALKENMKLQLEVQEATVASDHGKGSRESQAYSLIEESLRNSLENLQCPP